MSRRTRYTLLAVFAVLLAGVLLLHRWPWRGADPVDLNSIPQRIAGLERDLDVARSTDPSGAYVPRMAGSIADLRQEAGAGSRGWFPPATRLLARSNHQPHAVPPTEARGAARPPSNRTGLKPPAVPSG
jgi:hypothetical protein